jgi:hypothetical protein
LETEVLCDALRNGLTDFLSGVLQKLSEIQKEIFSSSCSQAGPFIKTKKGEFILQIEY